MRGQWAPPETEGKGAQKAQRVSGERPVGAAGFRQQSTAGVMPLPFPLDTHAHATGGLGSGAEQTPRTRQPTHGTHPSPPPPNITGDMP